MRLPKYKKGDLVTCPFSEEIEQPMEIIGRNTWYTSSEIIVYYVKGTHKKKKNELTIQLEEVVLVPFSSK